MFCMLQFLHLHYCETCQWLKFPLNGLQAQSRVRPVVGLLPLASGPGNETLFPNWDRLCGLVVRVSGYRYRGLGFDSRRYQIF